MKEVHWKIASVVLAIPTFILAVIGVVSLFKGPALEVTIRHHDFALPSKANGEIEGDSDRTRLHRVDSLVRISLINTGTDPLEDCRLRLSGDCYYVLSGEGNKRQEGEFTDVLKLGRIEALESIELLVWPTYFFPSSSAVSVAYTNGHVQAFCPERINPSSHLLAGLGIAVVALVSIFGLQFLLAYYLANNSNRPPAPPRSEPATDSVPDTSVSPPSSDALSTATVGTP